LSGMPIVAEAKLLHFHGSSHDLQF